MVCGEVGHCEKFCPVCPAPAVSKFALRVSPPAPAGALLRRHRPCVDVHGEHVVITPRGPSGRKELAILDPIACLRIKASDRTFSVEAREGDVYLLCSDGLTTMVDVETLLRTTDGAETLTQAARELIRAANRAGGEDNITVIVAEMDGEGLHETVLNERMTRTLQSISEFNFRTGGGYAPAGHGKPTVTLGAEQQETGPVTPKVFPVGSRETSEFDSTHSLASSTPAPSDASAPESDESKDSR